MAQKQYKFTLSIRDKHNREVKKIVDFLIGKGILSQAIRDGLRLLNDLRKGNTRVLLEMFPEVMDKLCPPQSNNGDVLREIEALRGELRQLQQRPMPQSEEIPDARNYGIPAMKSLAANMGGHTIAMPVILDDEEDTIIVTQSAGQNSGDNFLAAFLKVGF